MKHLKPPILSMNFSENKKNMKKRISNVLSINNKHNGKNCLVLLVLCVAIVGLLVGCTSNTKDLDSDFSGGVIGGADGPTAIIVGEKASLDERVSLALLGDNNGKYADGECKAEGHIILGSEEKDNKIIVYALTMYGEYGFQDGNMVKLSGSGTIPAVITFDKTETGEIVDSIEYPRDGSDYLKSIKEMFPLKYHSKVTSISNKDSEELKEQEVRYVNEYLNQLGRNAKIGEYGDFEHTLLTSVGVSVDVSNKLVEKAYANYPHWIGSQEIIENGVRYVYKMDYQKENNLIILTKSNYETKEVVEEIKINSLTGEVEPN